MAENNITDNKYMNMYQSNTARKKRQNRVRMKFNIENMNAFCRYVLSENSNIHRSGLSNLRDLLTGIDISSFDNNKSLLDRYYFCLDVLKSRLDKNLSTKELILQDVMGIISDKYPDLDINSFGEVSNPDVEWMEREMISSCLNARLINNSIYELQEECAKYVTAEPSKLEERIKSVYDKIEAIHRQKRKNEIDADEASSLFQLSEFKDTVTNIWNSQINNGHRLKTGIQALNRMLGGGFEERRVYCVFGLPGEGKTITLLNLLYQLKKNNSNIKTKDPTMKPCIVLLTMENFIHEEVQTLYNIMVSNDDISSKPLDTVVNEIENSDLFKPEDGGEPTDIELFIKFKPINSVTTDYLYKITEDLKDMGYEVVCMIQDYIMRIKSADDNNVEDRIRWGNIINEFKNYAMYYSIPVITAAQLNRDAARTIDQYRRECKFDDMIEHIGRSNIAESSQIDFNLDAIIFIAPCTYIDDKWLGFKLIKKRYKADLMPSDYVFFHPFVKGMPAKLEEDLKRASSLSRHSLSYDPTTATAAAFDNAARFSRNKNLAKESIVIGKQKVVDSVGFITNPYDASKKSDKIIEVCKEYATEELSEKIFRELVNDIYMESPGLERLNLNPTLKEAEPSPLITINGIYAL